MNILNVSMKPVKARSTTLITKCDAVTYRFKGKSDVVARPKAKKKKRQDSMLIIFSSPALKKFLMYCFQSLLTLKSGVHYWNPMQPNMQHV